MILRKPILLLSLFLYSICVMCQETRETVTIITLDKSIYTGGLDKITKDSVFIVDKKDHKLGFAKSNIIELWKGSPFAGEIRNISEPYYVSTAYNNGKGNHYYKNYYLFGNNFSYGANDNLDVHFGFEFYSFLGGFDGNIPILQLGVNYGGEISESIGIGFSSKALFNDQGGLIFATVPFTLGNTKNNFTVSPGLIYVSGIDNPQFIPMANLNLSLGQKTRWVTDAVYLDEVIVGTSMLEYTFRNGYSILGGVLFSDEITFIPNFSVVIPYGKWKKNRLIKK